MSFKIFSLQLTGKIKPVTTIEKQRKVLVDDYVEFQDVSASEELKAFIELKDLIHSDEFNKNKKKVENLHFKGSEEDNQLKEFMRLKKSARIKKYFAVVNSNELSKFEYEKDGQKMKDYYALLEYMKEGQFEKEKKAIQNQVFKGSVEERHLKDFKRLDKSAAIRAYKELEGSEKLDKHKSLEETEKFKRFNELKNDAEKDNEKQKEFKAIKKDGDIRSYFKFEKSKKLKLYNKTVGSHDLQRYNELKEFTTTEEFKKQEAFLKDKKKFKGSVEEKQLSDFKRLNKSAAIRTFNELEGSEKVNRHKSFAESEKLKRFDELKNASVKASENRKEFKALKGDGDIRSYFKFEKSKKLKLYNETVGSHDLQRYNELKEFTTTEEFKKQEAFLKDKKKFEKSEAFQKQNEYKKLSADGTVKFVLRYEKSKLYKNYLDVKDSFDLKRYFELEELFQSEEFKKRKAWLEDKKRWEKTEEFKKEQQYEQEKTTPGFIKYFKYKDTDDFDFLKNWEVVFEDDFAAKELDTKKWGICTAVAEKLLGENYAMPGDLSFFTSGNNLKIDKTLCIQVKKEKATGKVWQMTSGLVPTDFEYTTGLITSGGKFAMEDGILEAKITFNPVKQVASSFYLSGDEVMPRINLVEMGARNNVGISTINGKGKIENTGLDISNLKKGEYIFALEKTGAGFTWKINEAEVWKQDNSALNKSLQLTASSMVIDKLSGSSNFEIEWVKCYRKK